MTIRGFAIFCVVVGIVGLTAIFSIERLLRHPYFTAIIHIQGLIPCR